MDSDYLHPSYSTRKIFYYSCNVKIHLIMNSLIDLTILNISATLLVKWFDYGHTVHTFNIKEVLSNRKTTEK